MGKCVFGMSGIMFIEKKKYLYIDLAYQVQILDKVIYISLHNNSLEKDVNPPLLLAIDNVAEQTGFSNLGRVPNLESNTKFILVKLNVIKRSRLYGTLVAMTSITSFDFQVMRKNY